MNKKSIRTLDALAQHGLVKKTDLLPLQKVVKNLLVGISGQMLELIDQTNSDDPIAKQFVPSTKELHITPLEQADPIGDEAHTTVRGIIHRYPDRCLFTPVHTCPVYCRFCFRKEKVGSSKSTLTQEEMTAAFAYMNHHQEIWEVILTGGDPLILKPATLKKIMDQLNVIHHLEVIRIHTRVPVVESHRVTKEMIAALKSNKALYIILHANHPKEFTKEAQIACKMIVDAGIPMLSQTVLLKDINDHIEPLGELMRCFIKNRIKPYYLHHGDLAKGTKHFRTSIEKGQQLMKQLRGRFSGLCQPTYVLDIPGGFGKTPIGPCYLTKEKNCCYSIEDYQGHIHPYFL